MAMELEANFMKKIRDLAEQKKVRNYKIHVSSGSNKGDNYLGVIAKVHIDGIDEKGEKITLNWIAKIAPKGELAKTTFKIDKLFMREIYIYENVLPLFAKLQDEKAVLKPFDSYAPYIMHYLEQYSFVMEDIKSLGYAMKDRQERLDYNHVKLVLEAYGKFHALSFALRDQQPEKLHELAEQTEEQMLLANSESDDRDLLSNPVLHSKVLRCLDSKEDAEAIEQYKKFKERNSDIIAKVLKTTNEYSVINHGDNWLNNIMFKYENKEHPDRPTGTCLLDWQLSRFGSPVLDLSYFIFTCTDKTLRDRYYDQMIKLYYHTLCQHLADLGSDPEKLFPFAALQAELKRASVFGLHMSTIVMHFMMGGVDDIPDFQNSNDIKDLDTLFMSVNNHLYAERARDVVLDIVKYGYLDQHI